MSEIANLFYTEVGTGATHRQSAIIDSVANGKPNPSVGYEFTIRSGTLYADEGVRNEDEFLYLNPSPASMLDRNQTIITPAEDASVDLTWKKYPNRARISLWRKMQAVIAENQANGHVTNYDTVETITFNNSGSNWAGGILLPTEEIYMSPLTAIQGKIINPILKTVTSVGPTGPYSGCILLNDNTILLEGSASKPETIIDFEGNVIRQASNVRFSGRGVLYSDGRVCYSPNYGHTSSILDPISLAAESFGTITGSSANGGFVSKAVLHPNNKYISAPYSASSFIISDPILKTNSYIGLSNTALRKYSASCLLYDERIFATPTNINNPAILDVSTQTLQPWTVFNSATQWKFSSCHLLPDGRVLGVAGEYSYNVIFDFTNNTVTNLSFLPVSGNPKYSGGKLLPSGKILIMPSSAPHAYLISASDGNYGALPDLDTCLSVYLNGCM